MEAHDGKVLKDDARLGIIRDEFVNVRLRFLAMRALEICKLHQLQILCGASAVGAVGALLQLPASVGEGIHAKVDDFVSSDNVFAVGQNKKLENLRLLFAGLVADQNVDLA